MKEVNMKARIKKEEQLLDNIKATKTFSDSEQLNKELEEIVENFEMWLKLSHLSMEEFLAYSDVDEFEIYKKEQGDYIVISLGYKEKQGQLSAIGETIAYPANDPDAAMSCAILIMYIAARLDEKNEVRQNYFWNIAKKFCQLL